MNNELITVPRSGLLFSFANGAHKISVKFCVVKFSSFGWNSFDGLWKKEWKEPKLGDSHGIPSYYPKRSKQLSLGMPRVASLFLLTTIGILLEAIFLFVTYYEFCLERLVWYEPLLDLLFVLSLESLLDTLVWESQNYAMTC